MSPISKPEARNHRRSKVSHGERRYVDYPAADPKRYKKAPLQMGGLSC